MEIANIITHQQATHDAILMAFTLVITATMLGLTWFTFCASEAARAERLRFEHLEGKYNRLVARDMGNEGQRNFEGE